MIAFLICLTQSTQQTRKTKKKPNNNTYIYTYIVISDLQKSLVNFGLKIKIKGKMQKAAIRFFFSSFCVLNLLLYYTTKSC